MRCAYGASLFVERWGVEHFERGTFAGGVEGFETAVPADSSTPVAYGIVPIPETGRMKWRR